MFFLSVRQLAGNIIDVKFRFVLEQAMMGLHWFKPENYYFFGFVILFPLDGSLFSKQKANKSSL